LPILDHTFVIENIWPSSRSWSFTELIILWSDHFCLRPYSKSKLELQLKWR